ncbi:MAG: chromate transporter [Anaerolineaceae bacterium]|nr:chromate transporter [Anaerolineaceae bacterium]
MNLLEFLWLFLKASLFSTGGLGNLPFLHQDLLALGWAAEADFLTALAVGQVSPGPTGLWSVSLGYLIYGLPGALLALLALTLPPLLVLGVQAVYNRLEGRPVVQNFTRGLSLGVIGLTLAVTFSLAQASVTDWRAALITGAALVAGLNRRVPVIVILAVGALAGWLFFR